MAQALTSGPHQSPQSSLPPLSQKVVNTFVWGSGGNSVVINDEYVHPNSQVDWWVTGTTPQAGQWSITVSQGTFTLTSSDVESATLPVSYVVY
jgi:hypothetical protein